MVAERTLLHQDDGLILTRRPGERLADLELEVVTRFLLSKGRVLDIGCGRGRACRYLEVDGFETVGVELDSETLREGRLPDRGSGSVPEFILADARELCFRDCSFDYTIFGVNSQ